RPRSERLGWPMELLLRLILKSAVLPQDWSDENNDLDISRGRQFLPESECAMRGGEFETIREHLERMRAVTLQSLERTPPHSLRWSPSPGLMTFAGQFSHLANVERLYVRGLSGAGWRAEANTLEGPNDIDKLRAELLDARAATTTW